MGASEGSWWKTAGSRVTRGTMSSRTVVRILVIRPYLRPGRKMECTIDVIKIPLRHSLDGLASRSISLRTLPSYTNARNRCRTTIGLVTTPKDRGRTTLGRQRTLQRRTLTVGGLDGLLPRRVVDRALLFSWRNMDLRRSRRRERTGNRFDRRPTWRTVAKRLVVPRKF